MTFGPPQPRMAGSRFLEARVRVHLGVVESAIAAGTPEPSPEAVAAVEEALAIPYEEEKERSFFRITMRQIAMEVCGRRGVSFKELLSDRKHDYVVKARQEIWWRCREETLNSFPAIGKFFKRDHSTIIHGVQRHEERLAKKKTTGGCGRRNLVAALQNPAPTIRVVNE